MTPGKLKEVADSMGIDDLWWVALDEETVEEPTSSSELKKVLEDRKKCSAQVIHVSRAEVSGSSWIRLSGVEPPTEKKNIDRRLGLPALGFDYSSLNWALLLASVSYLLLYISPYLLWVKFGLGGISAVSADGNILVIGSTIAATTFILGLLFDRIRIAGLLLSNLWALFVLVIACYCLWVIADPLSKEDLAENPLASLILTQVTAGAGVYIAIIGSLGLALGCGFLSYRALREYSKQGIFYSVQLLGIASGITVLVFYGSSFGIGEDGEGADPDTSGLTSAEGLSVESKPVDTQAERLKREREEKERLVAEKYIESSLLVYDVSAKYFNSLLDGEVPGVKFKIKNNGDQTVTRLEVTVFFKDSNGMIIAEESYLPIFLEEFNFGGEQKALKPGYIWQQEKGKFYSAKSVPSEWAEGRISIKVSDITLADPDQNGTR